MFGRILQRLRYQALRYGYSMPGSFRVVVHRSAELRPYATNVAHLTTYTDLQHLRVSDLGESHPLQPSVPAGPTRKHLAGLV